MRPRWHWKKCMEESLNPWTLEIFVSIIFLTCFKTKIKAVKDLKNNCKIFISDPAAGASDDWYKGVLNSRFVYTVELRDTGHHGFVLPPNQIKPRFIESGLIKIKGEVKILATFSPYHIRFSMSRNAIELFQNSPLKYICQNKKSQTIAKMLIFWILFSKF